MSRTFKLFVCSLGKKNKQVALRHTVRLSIYAYVKIIVALHVIKQLIWDDCKCQSSDVTRKRELKA